MISFRLFISTAALITAHAAIAQTPSLPNCRDISVKVGDACTWSGIAAVQKRLEDINLPPSARFTEPYPTKGTIAPDVPHRHIFDLTAVGTVQAETLSYRKNVSTGFQVEGAHPLTPYFSLALRGEIIRFRGIAGKQNENNHTAEMTAGGRVQLPWRISPYAEALAGAGHQYGWGLPVVGIAGVRIRLTKNLSFIPAEANYEWYFFEPVTPGENPHPWRIDASTGIAYHFGN